MAAPDPHVLIAALNYVGTKLGTVSRNTGYRRDYRGVRGFLYDFPMEDDLTLGWIQIELGEQDQKTEEGNEISNTLFRHQIELRVRVHVLAERVDTGELDVNTPVLQTMADIHSAMFADRTQGGSVLSTHYAGSERAGFTVDKLRLGVTLTETYLLDFDHLSGDMASTS